MILLFKYQQGSGNMASCILISDGRLNVIMKQNSEYDSENQVKEQDDDDDDEEEENEEDDGNGKGQKDDEEDENEEEDDD